MFGHEPVTANPDLWRPWWNQSGTGKSHALRSMWLVKHVQTSRVLPSGLQHYVALATNVFSGAVYSVWRTGSRGQACQRPYLTRSRASGLPDLYLSTGETSMAAGPKIWTDERVAERFAEGRGQGTHDNYIPWVWVQEFSSKANQTRIPSVRLRRTIHTFSYLERAMYLWHEYRGFDDYREQFPMDRRITLGAAQALKIRHPLYPTSRTPTVMMLDALVVTKQPNGDCSVEAWDAKPLYKLRNKRVRAKLSLHKAFCAYLGIQHSLFTEKTKPRNVMKWIEWARGGLAIEDELLPYPSFLDEQSALMLSWLRSRNHAKSICELAVTWDEVQGFESGTSLRLFKILVWHKKVYVDLDQENLCSAVLPDQRFYINKELGHGSLPH